MDIISQKHCSGCNNDWPANNTYFGNDKWMGDKLTTRCRVCRNKQTKESKKNHSPKRTVYTYDPSLVVHKKCSECQQTKLVDLENFYPSNREKYGVAGVCRVCRPAYMARLAQAKLEKELALGKKECTACHREFPPTPEHFFQNGPGLHSQCKDCRNKVGATYREGHRENLNSQRRERGKANKVQESIYNEAYRKSHLEQFRVYSHNRRAKEKAVSGIHTAEQVLEQLKRQKYCCYYAKCGFSKFPRTKENGKWKYLYEIEHTFPLDRVVGMNIPANDMGYIVLACEHCNSSKGAKFPWEWAEGGRLL